jgi:kexin
MTFWGETIDASKAKLFELPDKIAPLPPHHTASSSVEASTTKTFARPTQGLPTDHATAEGENSKPAFPPQDHSNATMPSTSPSSDETFVTGVTSFVQRNTGLFVVLGIVTLISICFGVLLCRRASARRRLGADYSAVPEEATAMTSLERGNLASGRSTEGFDTFGVGEDEDDEQTGLVHHDEVEAHERYRDLPQH